MAATVLDRLIGWVDPRRGALRVQARGLLQRAYEAASPRDGWRPRRKNASAAADHLADAATLRAKARSLVQNVPYVRAGIEALVSHTIGTGILPVPQGSGADAALKLFREWSKVCDADGRSDFYGLQALAYRAMEQDGEVLVRLRARRPTDGLPVPLQLQVLEIDWLDSARQTGAAPGNDIVNGIEFDPLGNRVAYWLYDTHPGDTAANKLIRRATLTSRRVTADRVLHLYRVERPGQPRGFSRLAPIIARTRDLQLYEDAEQARKNLESRLAVLASGDVEAMGNGADTTALAGAANLGDLPSGGIVQVPAGVNLTTVQPNAAQGYVDNVKFSLHLIASGLGVPYECITGDMSETNFSSARMRWLPFRRDCDQTQWLTLVPQLLNPLWAAFVDAARLANKLGAYQGGIDWSTPRWEYVQPDREVRAEIDAITMGGRSISEWIRRQGYDPAQVRAELAADIKALKEDGVMDFMQTFRQATAAPETRNTDTPT